MNRISYFRVTVCVAVLLSVSTLLAQMPQPFSADFSTTSKTQTAVAAGKIFFSVPNIRMNMDAQGRDISMIVNGGTKTTYMVMHQQHMYMEMKEGSPLMRTMPHMDGSFDPKNPCASRADTTCKNLGSELVNDRMCDKWLITQKNGNSTTTWVDQKLHFPIKSQNPDGSTVEFTNIKEGPQPASLFEPPSDYRKMDMGNMRGGNPPQ